jgi:Flp pilus assembly protein TadD
MKRAGKLDEALQFYKKALDLEPENSVVLYNTGILYNIKSEYENAVEVLE